MYRCLKGDGEVHHRTHSLSRSARYHRPILDSRLYHWHFTGKLEMLHPRFSGEYSRNSPSTTRISRAVLTNPIQTDQKALAEVEEENSSERPARFQLDFRHRQKLKILQDKIGNARTILQSTIETIKCLQRYHKIRKESFGSASGSRSANVITTVFEEQLRQAYSDLTKFESLNERIRDTASLVSDLLSYDHAFSLEQLVQEQKDDSSVMRALFEKATEDSRSIKIITIITAIFLPATVTAVRILWP